CRKQSDRERASYCQGEPLLAALGDLFRAEALRLSQGFASQARVSTGFDNRNKDVVGKLDAAGVMPVFVGEQSPVHQLVENRQRYVSPCECVIQSSAIAMTARSK